jgi:urease subunit alpha
MGCPGLKIHEDQGGTPEIVDATLGLCEAYDVQLCLHTDGLHESAELEDTVAAVAGRTMHAYHVEGAGGGHMPDLIKLVREPNIICSSTNPAVPWGPSAAEEHFLMTAIVHNLHVDLPEEAALVRERIHPRTMAAEGPLHELGGIAILSSDSQGMGRIGETVRKAWQLADVMKRWRGSEAGAGFTTASPTRTGGREEDDNERVLRYLSKYTIEPAIAHGIAGQVGTLAPGRLADIVLWAPATFGVRPQAVFKGGMPAWGPLGEGNATVRLAQPVRYGPDWGALGAAAAAGSALFVSQAALEAGIAARTGTGRRVLAVRGCRSLTRADLWANRAVVPVEVDPRDGTVTLGGRVLAAEPVQSVPLSRRYLLG